MTDSEPHLIVTDPVTNTTLRVPISKQGTIPASVFTAFRLKPTTPPSAENDADTVPLRLFDPGFKNTVVCRSSISMVDGDNGRLYYRGYDVETLVETSSYLEVAYLLIHGELPSAFQLDEWTRSVMMHTYIHSEIDQQMHTFRYDAHPMGMLISTVASLSTFHPDANPALKGDGLYMKPKIKDVATPAETRKMKDVIAARERAIFRMLGKVPTIAANSYRQRIGRTYNHPMPGCFNYTENLLYMLDRLNEPDYKPDARLVRILDKMFILLAEHGSNCSTVTMRHLASSGVDPYTALSGAMGALLGERKSPAVIGMLMQIEKVENIQVFLSMVKRKQTISGKSEEGILLSNPTGSASKAKPTRLMGFGHRIYKTHDPRVKLCKALALELFELMGKGQIGDLALALEEAALADEWFSKRGLYPNIDYWSAVVFHTLGFPPDMFPVLMSIARVAGFIAHWQESLDDPEYKIYRPRQIYIGEFHRNIAERSSVATNGAPLASYVSSVPLASKRRTAADEVGLAELNAQIFSTQKSIAELNATIAHLRNESSVGAASTEAETGSSMADRLAIGPVSSWMVKRLFSSPSAGPTSDNSFSSTEKLSKAQDQLSELLKQQQALLTQVAQLNAEVTEPAQPATPPKHVGLAEPQRAAFKEPNLLAGSKSPRVVKKS